MSHFQSVFSVRLAAVIAVSVLFVSLLTVPTAARSQVELDAVSKTLLRQVCKKESFRQCIADNAENYEQGNVRSCIAFFENDDSINDRVDLLKTCVAQ